MGMSDFRDMITSDLDDVFLNTDEFAKAITYNGVSINAIIEYGKQKTKDSIMFDAMITVKVSDVAVPVYRDVVVIGSDTYHVFQDNENQPSGDGYMWQIPLSKGERAPIGGRNR